MNRRSEVFSSGGCYLNRPPFYLTQIKSYVIISKTVEEVKNDSNKNIL